MEPNRVQAVIKMAVLILFVGYVFIWVILPTNLYKKDWLLKIRAKTMSTYFGTQGATMLINTFPGCVYLHFVHKTRGNDIQGKQGSDALQRPMIEKGLGVVNGIELWFFMMFIALLIWSFSAYLEISFVKITAKSAAKSGEKVWEARLDSAALRLGLIGNICLAFLFFPVTRGSSVLPLLGITSESSVKYHIWLGHIVMTLFTAYGVCYIVYWAVTNQLSEGMRLLTAAVSIKSLKPSCENGVCSKAITMQRLHSFTHLYTLLLLGPAEQGQTYQHLVQINLMILIQRRKGSRTFFIWWMFSYFTGVFIATVGIVYIQENYGWGLGYGIPTIGLI